ncbi:peptidoglycan editing factor PgeF [Granulosicoccus sp. 3-233]|uniref:peptidoglycan editing factor PgeF n=1 Tax=Granulosicoccus sp. 3-233 TaxID=3417969 RepID=UPI003D333E27
MRHDLASGRGFGVITGLTPQWQVSSRVTAFATTRLGGVSQAPYDSLNLGLHVGDELPAVEENRRRVVESFALPGEPCWLHQTHSEKVLAIGSEKEPVSTSAPSTEQAFCADGSWTDQPNVVLAVLTADCLPVVISDAQGSQLAVVHAGWRGLAAGILENALARFSPAVELHAWLGPAIGPDAFEIGEEVRQAFIDRKAAHGESFLPGRTDPAAASGVRFWADIYALARTELQACRSVVVTGGDYCTVSQPQWFHSHRRDGLRSGRLATMAWMDASRS